MDTLLDLESISLLDFDSDLPCEGVNHGRGLSGHVPTESGGYMVISPCCGPKVIQCSPRVAAMRRDGVVHCGECKREHSITEYSFLPLGG